MIFILILIIITVILTINKFKILDSSQAVKWVPKYSGISEEDQCKLYCRVENSF